AVGVRVAGDAGLSLVEGLALDGVSLDLERPLESDLIRHVAELIRVLWIGLGDHDRSLLVVLRLRRRSPDGWDSFERDLVAGEFAAEEGRRVGVGIEDSAGDHRADAWTLLPLRAVKVWPGAVGSDAPPGALVVGLPMVEANQRR